MVPVHTSFRVGSIDLARTQSILMGLARIINHAGCLLLSESIEQLNEPVEELSYVSRLSSLDSSFIEETHR